MKEEKKWEKPTLSVISSVNTSENVLWGSPGGDPRETEIDPNAL